MLLGVVFLGERLRRWQLVSVGLAAVGVLFLASSTGIGLCLCKELIEAEGGKIGAHTNQGQGATFWFSLPV